ncbi:alpha/beta hydrolase family protein [Sphingobacterium corticis]|uniref:Alpha/beta hydrolase family protein n=1 Tax=Sphingobacterium corticis TaxID=1812823 RepID=A0ABW5NIM7_9SPHI
MNIKSKLLSIAALAIVQTLSAQSDKITVTDLTKIKQITDLQVNADISEAAYSVKSVTQDTAARGGYTYKTQWFTRALKSKKLSENALNNALDERIEKIIYTPDGKRWALVKKKEKVVQLHPYSSNELDTSAFFRGVTYPIQQVRFSADSKRALFSVRLTLDELIESKDFNPKNELPKWSYERPGDANNASLRNAKANPNADGDSESVAAYLLENEKKELAKRTNKLQFQTENSTTGTLYFVHWYAVDLKEGSLVKPLTSGFRSYPRAEFLSDKQIIASTDRDTIAHPDRINTSDIVIFDTQNGTHKTVLGDGQYRYQLEAVASSGKYIAVNRNIPNVLTQSQLLVYETKNWKGKPIDYDRTAGQVLFGEGDSDLYFISPSNGGKVVNRVELSTGKIFALTSVDEGINEFWIGKNKAIYAKTTFANPAELFLADANFSNEEVLTALNSEWLKEKAIVKPEKFTFKNELGLDVEYWLLKPTKGTADEKAPLLVEIHGGPASMFGPGDASMWHEYQYFAARGYGVIYGNPRGSSGYGEDFLKSNYRDWGKGPSTDVLSALDHVVAQNWVDTTRLYLTGGSYGAFLTTWIISHDHRFRAASSQRGVYDLYTFFGSGNVWPMLKRYFGGFPWEDGILQVLQEQSPINYATAIKTPLLIFTGENDNRTGPVQGDYLYKQLKYLGRDVEYIRHPGADHEITRSGNVTQRIDQMLRTYEFFERFKN